MSFLALVGLVMLAAPASTPTPAPDPAADLNRLFEIAGAYPPRLTGPADRAQAEALWFRVRSALESVSAGRPNDYRTHLTFGLLYRCGYNLDLKEAASSELVVRHFKAASVLEPLKSEPHYESGEFLLTTGRFEEGKRELDLALSLASDADRPPIIHNLCFAAYYLKDFRQAITVCTQALAFAPDHPGLKIILERSQAVLGGGPPPETIVIPAEDVPDGKIIRPH